MILDSACLTLRFVGPLDRDELTVILHYLPEGSFCVRESKARQGEFALGIKFDGQVRHVKIEIVDVG